MTASVTTCKEYQKKGKKKIIIMNLNLGKLKELSTNETLSQNGVSSIGIFSVRIRSKH